MAHILDACYLLPCTFGVQNVFQASQSGFVRQLGKFRLALWCDEPIFRGDAGVGSVSSSSCCEEGPLFDVWRCWVRDGWTAVSLYCLLS